MKKDNKIINDLAKLVSSSFAGAVNIKNDLSEYIKNQIEKLLKKMDFVTRKEFEVVKKLAQDNAIELNEMKKLKTQKKMHKVNK